MNYLPRVVMVVIWIFAFVRIFKGSFSARKSDKIEFFPDKKTSEIYKHIRVNFKDLESQRESLLKKIKVIIRPIMAILSLLYLFVANFREEAMVEFLDIDQGEILYVHFFALVIILMIGAGIKQLMAKKFINKAKTRLVNFILKEKELDGLKYQAKDYIPRYDFLDTKIFYDNLKNKEISTYKGEDLIFGKFKEVDFRMSQLKVEASSRNSSKKKKRKKSDKIFKGTLIEFDFNKEARTDLILKVDNLNKIFGSYLSSRLERTTLEGYQIVKLENPKFEKTFKVISKSQQDARYILKPAFMEDLMNLNQKISKVYFKGKRADNASDEKLQVPMEISIVKNKIYIALGEFDLFDIDIYKQYGVDIEIVEDYIRVFDLLEIIVQDLKSNRDIFKSL